MLLFLNYFAYDWATLSVQFIDLFKNLQNVQFYPCKYT